MKIILLTQERTVLQHFHFWCCNLKTKYVFTIPNKSSTTLLATHCSSIPFFATILTHSNGKISNGEGRRAWYSSTGVDGTHIIMCDWVQTISSNRTVITRISQVFRWTSIEWAGWKTRDESPVEWSLIKRECNLVIFISLLSATGVSRVFISSVGV